MFAVTVDNCHLRIWNRFNILDNPHVIHSIAVWCEIWHRNDIDKLCMKIQGDNAVAAVDGGVCCLVNSCLGVFCIVEYKRFALL